ncbi:hypothetical protein ACVWYU_003106 [Pseudomonas sp. TE12234]
MGADPFTPSSWILAVAVKPPPVSVSQAFNVMLNGIAVVVYRAPPAHAMTGPFNRLLVIASDPASGERSVSLVTVQASAITINPLIQLCYHGQKVELSAGQLDGSALNWSIKNPVPGESGQLVKSTEPGGDHTYIAGPRVANKTYVLDEIEVSNSQGDTRSAHVLVLQIDPGVTVKPVEKPNLPPGQIQLQAVVNGRVLEAEWSLPLGGPGWIFVGPIVVHSLLSLRAI